ncbi:L,D-transpeptidase [Phenylobacterium aquaticum]|uniref:L,D-transpeptidase family protein n=1 Tax=Phenylobacterium aquaticum TaxID=1763816 RepID=UPI0026EEE767|nr:L,D-transpeptidase family protein [Phenylobacterium aquaticum]
MIFTAMSDGRFDLDGRQTRCALGKGGVKTAADKHEGDGASPLGTWALRRILYRPDRGPPPLTALPAQAIGPDDGWCDAPADPAYNTPVRLPYPASAEHLWREDHVYDLIGILAYNDDPPVPGKGSAIFLHIARDGYTPTEGCVALVREDLLELLKKARPGDAVAIVQA